jgi:transcription initiation factor IIE alpha subunit
MAEWTFVTNHAVVLSFIASHEQITARDLAQEIGITERATRKIIADLLSTGYITKKRIGRCNHYVVNHVLPLRHASHSDIEVGKLLRALGWKKNINKTRKSTS